MILNYLKRKLCSHKNEYVIAESKIIQEAILYCPDCKQHVVFHYGINCATPYKNYPVRDTIKQLGGVKNWEFLQRRV